MPTILVKGVSEETLKRLKKLKVELVSDTFTKGRVSIFPAERILSTYIKV